MERSPEIGKLAEALAKAQTQFKAIPRNKHVKVEGRDGRRGYEYAYAPLEAIIDGTRAALAANGLALIQLPKVGERDVIVTTMVVHSSGEFVSAEISMPLGGSGAQAVGSALSYARRYCMSAILGVATEDDDDGEAASAPNSGRVQDKPAVRDAVAQQVASREDRFQREARADGKPISSGRKAPGKLGKEGNTIGDMRIEDLMWWEVSLGKALDDPDKARYRIDNEADLAAIKDMIAWRKRRTPGVDAPTATDDIPFGEP